MTASELSAKLQEWQKLTDSVRQYMNVFEGQLENKENQIKLADSRLREVNDRLREEQSKAGGILSKATDEASHMRNEAADLLDKAKKEASLSAELKKQAAAAVADAEARSKKLQMDEMAFSNNVHLYERKKQALEQAMKA